MPVSVRLCEHTHKDHKGFPGASDGKESAHKAGGWARSQAGKFR